MSAYLGTFGNLIPVRSQSRLGRQTSRPVSYETTLGGRRKGHVGPRRHRTWDASINIGTPGQLASLTALLAARTPTDGWLWVDEWAQVTNVLTPDQEAWGTGWKVLTVAGDEALVGGQVATQDGVALSSLMVTSSNAPVQFGQAPVAPGQPVTVSAYVRAYPGANARLDLKWVSPSGEILPTGASSPILTENGSPLVRLSANRRAPADVGGVIMQVVGAAQIANPAVTWTDGPVDWFPGQGVTGVHIDGDNLDVINAVADPASSLRQAGMSFTVTEVG